jgi:DNA-directed RNA polymerase III subunit RPC1
MNRLRDAQRRNDGGGKGGGAGGGRDTPPQRVLENPLVKQIYTEPEAPRRVSRVDFGLMSGHEILKISELNVVNKNIYTLTRDPATNGVIDPHLGVCFRSTKCATCGLVLEKCLGHFGHIALALPVFHIGYFKWTIKVLQQICKTCGRVLLGDKDKKVDRRNSLRELANPEMDFLVREALIKRIFKRCRDIKSCPYCGAFNGNVKKISGVSGLRIVHDVYQTPKVRPYHGG